MENTSKNKFRAAVLVRQNEQLQILDLEKVDPSPGQVSVRMISASLCGAQWNEITGVKGADKFLPHMMGHEGVGIVVGCGDGVSKVKAGDFVILHWRKGSGVDCFGPKFASGGGTVGSGAVTTFAEYTIVAENRVTQISYNPDLKHIYPLVGCALSTSWGLLVKEVSARRGNSLLICGAGGLGMSLAFWANVLELGTVVLFDRFEQKRVQAEKLGAGFLSQENGDTLQDMNQSFDIVIDTTGSVENISTCFDRVCPKGQLVLVGQPRFGSVLTLNNPLRIFDGIRIFSSEGGQFSPDEDVSTILKLLESKRELLPLLVSHVIGLSQVNEGFQLMQSGAASRVVIDFEGENE